MKAIRQTKSSLSRHSFIRRSMTNAKTDTTESQRHLFPLQICTNQIKQLKEQIAIAEDELDVINKEIENCHYNIPIKIKNLENSNLREIQKQKLFLSTLNDDFEKSLNDLNSMKLQEQKLLTDIKNMENGIYFNKTEIEKNNYHLFKKGMFAGYLESQETSTEQNSPIKIQKPCHMLEIEKIWSDIREAELELLKWQNIDCQYTEFNQSEIQSNKTDLSEYLISFIMDALLHYTLDDDVDSIKETELNHLISFFDFSEEELAQIKSRKIK